MNAIAKVEQGALATMTETELCTVLQSSLYPGASIPSIKMVLGYCKAAGLDPMQKPVHIVPMKVKTGEKDDNGWDIKADRDVIMPGISLYRTQASRTGEYVGMTEPDFGPTKTMAYKVDHWEGSGRNRTKTQTDAVMEYPEWCRVTVKRMVAGMVCEFTAKEFWLENYATKSASSSEPNAMWLKRPFGQLAKCAEAQALRKGFPELGGAATAEEMEGKQIHPDDLPPPPAGTDKNVVDDWIKQVHATKTDADAMVVYRAGTAALAKDLPAATAFKNAVIAHRTKLREQTDGVTDVTTKDKPAATPAPTAAPAAETREKVDDTLPWQDDPSTGGEIKITYARLADMIVKANDAIALEIARDWLPEIKDPAQVAELTAKLEARLKEVAP